MFSSNTSQTSGGYEIQRSLRFNSADSAYLGRTPASAGNRQTFTWSAWIKIGAFKNDSAFISGGNNIAAWAYINFQANAIGIYETNSGVSYDLTTTQVFRDPSAWYHLVVAFDTTQATASNRIKLYVNGSQVTSFATANYPSQNFNTWYNSATPQGIGRLFDGGSGYYFDGYQTEIYMIDGQALTPSSFGAFDAQTGVWGPTPYAGSYGTNGFYLNFSDNSNTTAATLGKDYSGNSNNWTPNNFSVSAGAGNDSLVDVPTNWGTDTGVGGTVRGNYCTLNPLDNGGLTLSNGNLQFNRVGGWLATKATFGMSSGKWYWEIPILAIGASGFAILGIGLASAPNSSYVGSDSLSWGYVGGSKYTGGSAVSYGTAFGVNDVVGVAFDADVGSITFYNNGVSQGVAFSGLAAGAYFPMVSLVNDYTAAINFGQRPFAYTAPSGFKALNTQNLPTPTIGATTATQAGKFFNPVLYTGNGFPTSGTQSVSGVGFQPDWVWIKSRSSAGGNTVTDVVRGINSQLLTNTTGAQETNTDNITAFNSDGFSLGSNTTGSTSVNVNGQTYVAWNWKANGAGVTNTAGSITSTVSANTTSGFSIATFTGNGTAGATFGHGLGVAPKMVIIKSRGNARNWLVYHASIGATKFLQLDTTIEALTATTPWNDTAPTSSVVTLGTSAAGNESGVTRVAYCFSEVPGYSKFGSFVGNGSADGPFIYCGFKPKYLLFKGSNSATSWVVVDAVRNTSNVVTNSLFPDLSDAENTSVTWCDFLSNGFKIRRATFYPNFNGDTTIFMAFAEAPQKYALAR